MHLVFFLSQVFRISFTMHLSKLHFSLYLLSFSLLFGVGFGVDPLFNICSSSGNFTATGTYVANLNKLLSYLQYKTTPTGFGAGYVGQYQYRANGLALCRGDASAEDCKACVTQASTEIRKLCPYNKAAIIWYDYCLLKYSDTDFFGQIDEQNKFYMWNLNNVSHPTSFNKKTKNLLTHLADEAYVTPKMFATGDVKLDDSGKIYGLVQCTRDLSSTDCKKCLHDAISDLPSCCDGKEGGRVVGGSCNFRYEIDPFVNN